MKTFFLELNEFNRTLLFDAAKTFRFKNIEKLSSLHISEIHTDDTYESDWLEPWVQWVSIHTETPSQVHHIKHLGDVPDLKTPQIWEKLSEKGISSGIWGPMNASRNQAKNVRFFFPDPWTASEEAFPDELNALLKPLRWTSKNYTNQTVFTKLHTLSRLLKFLKKRKCLSSLFKNGWTLLKGLIRHKTKPFVFISFLDLLTVDLFLSYQKEYSPDFSLLFLNSIAHLQHHQWDMRNFHKKSPLFYGLSLLNQMLGKIFSHLKKGDRLLITNAFSQMNTEHEVPWILYRQIDHHKFLSAIGIEKVKVEPHMTHDAHLFFPSAKEREYAQGLLEHATLLGSNLFSVETYPEHPEKLFYKIVFTEEIQEDARFSIFGRSYRFFAFFKKIVKRTGRHIPQGTLLSSEPLFPKKLYNHEIFSYLFQENHLETEDNKVGFEYESK